RSRPWRPWELEAATELRSAIVSVDLRRQFKKEQLARTEAEAAVRAREELISVVSHDLKNPLNAIVINAQLIERLAGGEQQIGNLSHRIYRSASAMNSLIEDLLDITKIAIAVLALNYSQRPFEEAVEEVREMLSPLAEQKSIELQARCEPLPALSYDYGRVLQVLSNLVGNAVKFTPKKGEVVIQAHADGEALQV